MDKLELSVLLREGKVHTARPGSKEEVLIPGVIYSKGTPAQSIAAPRNNFSRVHRLGGSNHVIEVKFDDGTKTNALIHDTQINPRTNEINHFDLLKIKMNEKIKSDIPLHFTGDSPVTQKDGMISTLLDTIAVEALPADLPNSFEVDLSRLEEIGQTLTVADVVGDHSNVTILSDMEEIVAKADQQTVVEEEPVAEEESEEAATAETGETDTETEVSDEQTD